MSVSHAERRRADALVIVAKYPEPGAVKTRLGAALGHERAARLYRAFLRDLAERFGAAEARDGFDLRWACAPGPQPLHEIVGREARVFEQRGQDFSERLYAICLDMRAAGYRRLVILSSDSPQLPAQVARDAFAALGGPGQGPGGDTGTDGADVALGPAEDGGYYLIALPLDAEPPDLFRGIQMSTPTVLAETLARARTLGLRARLLPPTFDVDEAPDLERLRAALDADPALAPQTRAALRELEPFPEPFPEPLPSLSSGEACLKK